MVLRLSELLERIRPAGAPGAPTEGERSREDADQARQLAEIAAVLSRFEAEVDQVVAAAKGEAEQTRRASERRAKQIRATLPDRIATAGAATVEQAEQHRETKRTQLAEDAEMVVARLEAQGSNQIPRLVDATIEAIWATVEPGRSLSESDRR